MTSPASIALLTGVLALAVWTLAIVVTFIRRQHEHRGSHVLFVGVSWFASLGTLASALGSAEVRGLVQLGVPTDVLSFVASFGRGALLAGGVLFIARWMAPRDPR